MVVSQTNVIRGLGCLILRVTAAVISNIENQIRHCSQHRPACQTLVVVEIWSVGGRDKKIYIIFFWTSTNPTRSFVIHTNKMNAPEPFTAKTCEQERVCLSF